MRRVALALLLAFPLVTAAQYPYPPPPVRVAPYGYPPPPPPVFVAPRAPPLSPFYFNVGLGYGFESWYAPQAYHAGPGGLAYHLEAGPRLMPQLLLGFDLSGLTTFANDPYGGGASVTVLDYDAVATLFPFVHGFFLRGGAGLSTLSSVSHWGGGYTYLGTNVLLGGGWAFPVAPPLHLTLGVDWTHQFFGSGDVTGLSTWMMRLGFGIY